MARSGSATSPPGLVIWSPWTPSLSASPEGIGPVWQLTAVDTATRYAVASLVAGDKSARDAASFVDHLAERLAGIGAELTAVLTDIQSRWSPWCLVRSAGRGHALRDRRPPAAVA
jgi:hypothetical protein